MMIKKFILTLLTAFSFFSLISIQSVKADDTEVFLSSGKRANVLLVFDLSSSMESSVSGSSQSKFEILLASLANVLNNLKDKPNLRIGLLMYGINGYSSGIRWPISDIATDANDIDSAITAGTYQTYSIILKQLADYGTHGGTPIVDALHEAALYFRGDLVSSGKGAVEPSVWDNSASTYAGGSLLAAHPATYSPSTAWNAGTGTFDTSATYISPITSSCDNNYIILMTDGRPNKNNYVDAIESMIGKTCAEPSADERLEGKCGPELVNFLANTDIQAAAGFVPSKIITHTIGFDAGDHGQAYMQKLANNSGGNFYTADNASQLEDSLNTALTKIAGENESFSGFTTTTKASTLSSDDRIFISMFKPDRTRSWLGNTKGYFIDPVKGLVDFNENPALETNGQFKSTAQSFWSGVDGNDVDKGGVSAKLTPLNRNIYTYTGTSPAPDNSTLTKINATSGGPTATMLAAADDTEKNSLITWLLDAPMGDPLHANSVMLSYPTKDVLFTMNNQGLLHIVDVTTPTGINDTNNSNGNELAAFIPQSLLANVKDHKANLDGNNHIYGLDGALSFWHDDKGTTATGDDKYYLYFGMRRGGNQYFALDVTNPSQPKLAWRIDGGSGSFAKLGQTWSRMTPTTVNWNSADKKVIFFGGGYDVGVDGYQTLTTDSNGNARSGDSIGNAIYMVDAANGDLLWSFNQTGTASANVKVNANLKYSIPSDLTVIDSDGDRKADRLYFGDMGGQIWRVDLTSTFGGSNGSYAYRLANLADNTAEGYRRFYMPPSIALVVKGEMPHYAVAIGSGFRAHPLGKSVNDRFYMLRDTNINNATGSPSWTTLTEGSLYDSTENLINEGADQAARSAAIAALASASGWYIKLGTQTGEKVLAPSLIFNNNLAFTTYTPGTSTSTCGGSTGNGRGYLVNLLNATPILDQNVDSNYTITDRYKGIPGIGIPSGPTVYFPPEKSHIDIYIGKNKAFNLDNPLARINWKVIE